MTERSLLSSETLIIASKIAITCVCLLIVAIPEGMPLAVSIAMALSVTRLKNDNILIKNLEAIQKCAVLDELCISKTGTLTNGINRINYNTAGLKKFHKIFTVILKINFIH